MSWPWQWCILRTSIVGWRKWYMLCLRRLLRRHSRKLTGSWKVHVSPITTWQVWKGLFGLGSQGVAYHPYCWEWQCCYYTLYHRILRLLPFWRTKPTESWRRTLLNTWNTRQFFPWRHPYFLRRCAKNFNLKVQGLQGIIVSWISRSMSFLRPILSTVLALPTTCPNIWQRYVLILANICITWRTQQTLSAHWYLSNNKMSSSDFLSLFTKVLIKAAISNPCKHFEEDILRLFPPCPLF